MTASAPPRVRESLIAVVAACGGLVIAAGAFLPWLSLYAGLHPMRGVVGLYGRLVAAAGVVCLVAGVRHLLRPSSRLRRAVTVLSWGVAAFAAWLTGQLFITYHQLQANPMLIPRLGPGLFVVLVGSLVVGITASVAPRPGASIRL